MTTQCDAITALGDEVIHSIAPPKSITRSGRPVIPVA
jgi:hypothetical protein